MKTYPEQLSSGQKNGGKKYGDNAVKILRLILTVMVVGLWSLTLGHSAPAAKVALPRSTPEAQGVDSAVIRAFVEAADKQVNSMHSFMLVRHGYVVAEG